MKQRKILSFFNIRNQLSRASAHSVLAALSKLQIRNSSSEASSPTFLRDVVMKSDFESYLCASLAPSVARESLLVTRAFNTELAAVREHTRGNLASGHLRLGFWRNMIDGAYVAAQQQQQQQQPEPSSSAVDRHPLYAPLRDSIKRHKHTRRWFERLIDARASDLDISRDAEQISVIPREESGNLKATTMSLGNSNLFSFSETSCETTSDTLAEAEIFAEQTNSTLLYLALEAVGVRDVHADHAASHIGKAVGLCALLRSLPVHCRQGQVFLPAKILSKHGLRPLDLIISPEDVFTPAGKSLLEEAEDNAKKTTDGDNGKRGLAMTLARSSSFGGGADIQSFKSDPEEPRSTLALPKKSINEGAGGIRLALSPAAVRLAAESNKTGGSLPIPKKNPLIQPAKQQRSAAWSAAAAVLRSGAGASQLVLVKSPEITALIREVVFDVACQAKAHLDHARGMQKLVPPAARAALLPAVCVDRFLRRLETQNFDIFSGNGVGAWSDGRPYARLLLQSEMLRFTVTNNY